MERAEQREQKDAASKVARLEDNMEVSNETEEVGSVANDALKGRKRTDHGVGMKAAAEKPIHKRAKVSLCSRFWTLSADNLRQLSAMLPNFRQKRARTLPLGATSQQRLFAPEDQRMRRSP